MEKVMESHRIWRDQKSANPVIMSYYSEGNCFVNMIRLWRSSCWILCGAWHGKLEANDAWTNGWSHEASKISFTSSLLWKCMNAILIWSKAIDQFQYNFFFYYSLLSPKMISFVLFPQASQTSMNFDISRLIYWPVVLTCFFVCLFVLLPFNMIPCDPLDCWLEHH